MIYVLSHADSDGRFGGFAAAKSLMLDYPFNQLKFIEVQYGQPFPVAFEQLNKIDTVYIIDFSYSREILDQVYEIVGKLVVLDHHESAEKQLAGAPYAIFDKTKSGALIAWKYFHPNAPVPYVCELVNDYDLWTKKYESDTPALEAWLQFEKPGQDWKHWNKLTYDHGYLLQALKKGKILHEQNLNIVSSFVKNEENYILGFFSTNNDPENPTGFSYAVYNGNTILRNEIAEALYTKHQLHLTLQWRVRGNNILFSVRATKPDEISASNFCSQFSKGGGNPKAGGFAVPLAEGFELIRKLMAGTYVLTI